MRSRLATKWFVVTAVLVSLALAGLASYYASSSPDGLNRVAADHGLDEKQKKSAADDSPLAGYDAKGVDNGRLSGGLAGVAGVAVVLVFAGGLAYAVRRKSVSEDGPSEPSDSRG